MPIVHIKRKNTPSWKPQNRVSPQDYLQILFDDLGYDRLHRNDKLSIELGRPVKFLDDLTEAEIKRMISILREQKYGSHENS